MDAVLGNLTVVADKVVDCVVLGRVEEIVGVVPDDVEFLLVWVVSVEIVVNVD